MKKLFLAALVSILLCGCSSSGKIRIGCAPKGGVYYSFGIVLSDIARHEGIELSVRETSGSSSNLRLLSEGYIQLGIAQSDRISHAYYDKVSPMKGYSAVASLYDEAVMIIVKADSGIQTVEDLENRRISIGEEESGTALNAREVLLAYGLGPENYITEFMNYSEASKALADNSIAAMFVTASPDAEMLRKLNEKIPIRLLSLDDKIIDRLGNVYAYFTKVIISKDLYRGMEEDAKTIGVRSVLLASDSLSESDVYTLIDILFDHKSEFDEYLGSDLRIRPETALDGLTIPLHPGALRYYDEQHYNTDHLR